MCLVLLHMASRNSRSSIYHPPLELSPQATLIPHTREALHYMTILRICSDGYADDTTCHTPTSDQFWCHPWRLTPHASDASLSANTAHTRTAPKSQVKGQGHPVPIPSHHVATSIATPFKPIRSGIPLPRVCHCSSGRPLVAPWQAWPLKQDSMVLRRTSLSKR